MSADLRFIFRQGIDALQQGRWDEAERHFRTLTGRTPNAPEPLYYLGTALLSGGRPAEAVEVLTRLVRKHGDNPMALNALGAAQAAGGNPGPAEKTLRRVLSLAPELADAADNLARLLIESGRGAEAVALLQSVLAREPGRFVSRHLMGRALRDCGRLEDAADAFRSVLDMQPDFLPAINDLGLLHHACGRNEDALACFERLLRLNPADPIAGNNRAMVLRALDRHEEAESQYRAILERFPDAPEINLNLGKLLARKRRGLDAATYLEKADCTEGRWWSALLLPLQYDSEENRLEWRRRFSEKAAEAASEIASLPASRLAGLAEILELDLFQLAYQGENDRDLNRIIRTAQSRVAQARYGFADPPRHKASSSRIRVGFVSQSFHTHVVCNMMRSWILGLCREEFEVFVFHTGLDWDQATDELSRQVEHFVDVRGEGNVAGTAALISEAELDVVIYPDVGLYAKTSQLPLLRLAPIQCAAFTHPVTTGMPDVDYFLSGELIEPPDANGHYTEKLVRLPGIGFNIPRPDTEAVPAPPEEPGRTGLRLFCAQSLFKILPRRDALFPRIAREAGAGRIDFIDHNGSYTDTFARRMVKAFAAQGMESDSHIRILPGVSSAEFRGLIKAADVFLDTPDWSGGFTTLEALACGTPVAAIEGRFMRGNVAAGILRAAGLDELVARDEDGYVTLVARLAGDEEYRRRISRTMRENAPAIFDNTAPGRHLAEFLRTAVRGGA